MAWPSPWLWTAVRLPAGQVVQKTHRGLVCMAMGKCLDSLCGNSVDEWKTSTLGWGLWMNQNVVYFGDCSIWAWENAYLAFVGWIILHMSIQTLWLVMSASLCMPPSLLYVDITLRFYSVFHCLLVVAFYELWPSYTFTPCGLFWWETFPEVGCRLCNASPRAMMPARHTGPCVLRGFTVGLMLYCSCL